jgi:tRNA A37 threonylcarbamoyladenosine synthetase subunit TsaC/SUA5/YrdC
MPNVKKLLEIIETKGPIYMTSANISGEIQLDINNARKVFPEIKMIYNFNTGNSIPSTIYSIDEQKVLREGKIKIKEKT